MQHSQAEDTQQLRLQVLELARDMLHNQYVDSKAQQHNDWIIKADFAWRTQSIKLAYPPFPPYFTEHDVVEKAKFFLQFVLAAPSSTASVTAESQSPEKLTDQPMSETEAAAIVEHTDQQETVVIEPPAAVALDSTDITPSSVIQEPIPIVQPLPAPAVMPVPPVAPATVESALAKPLKVFGNWRRSSA